jgi:transcriptional regulator with XRE-family HTH domain
VTRQGDEEFAKEFGDRIKAARLKAGQDQKELAELADLDIRTVRAIEAGKQMPDFVTFNLLLRALNVGAGEILDEAENA